MTVAILQARMSSSRLPGKVMKPLLAGGANVHGRAFANRFQSLQDLDAVRPVLFLHYRYRCIFFFHFTNNFLFL